MYAYIKGVLADVEEEAQVVVDFSHPSALSSILEYCRSHSGTAAVLCTTGYSAEQTQEIQEEAKELFGGKPAY